MPIKREHRWLYPIDWRQLSAAIRFRRAQGRCETCGRPHGRGFIILAMGNGGTKPPVCGGTETGGLWDASRVFCVHLPPIWRARESCSRPHTSIMIRQTTGRATSKHCVNGAICSPIQLSIGAGGG